MAQVQAVLDEAPAYHARMPKNGQKMSVAMSNAGALGWYTDKDGGYRYIAQHPDTGRSWPAIPQIALDVWRAVTAEAPEPEACLINLYRDTAKMGLHQDRDETDLAAPVLSVSLGDEALFRLGGTSRKDGTRALAREASSYGPKLAGARRHRR